MFGTGQLRRRPAPSEHVENADHAIKRDRSKAYAVAHAGAPRPPTGLDQSIVQGARSRLTTRLADNRDYPFIERDRDILLLYILERMEELLERATSS